MAIPGYRETWILLPIKATICEETGKVSKLEQPSYTKCDEAVNVFGEFENRNETTDLLILFPNLVKRMLKGWLK